MEVNAPIPAEVTSPRAIRARIPFVTTSFAQNLWYYALLWPVWWILGIEQILLPFYLIFEFLRLLVVRQGRFNLNRAGLWALLLAGWWVVPVIWADREFMDIFLKETATIWSQALMIILFWNRVRTPRERNYAIRALTVMAIYTALAGIIFLSGVWRGEFISILGRLLPRSLVDASAFFSSITYRQFGTDALEEVGLLPLRLMSFSLSFSSLSMACLLLIPLLYWRMQVTAGWRRLFFGGVALSLFVCLVFTESRITYAAFVAGVVFYIILRGGLLRGDNRPITIALTMAGIGLALLVGYAIFGAILQSFQEAFLDLRPSSWLSRFNIYLVTLRLLPEHPIAGWGVPVRIPGASNQYSAGTHSSYLGMLFQHGIVGLVFYLALWLSVWKQVICGLTDKHAGAIKALFWIAMATAFFAFNIREVADTWWWDQSLTFVIWMMWGLALSVPAGKGDSDQPL
jgi:hypothetical protein